MLRMDRWSNTSRHNTEDFESNFNVNHQTGARKVVVWHLNRHANWPESMASRKLNQWDLAPGWCLWMQPPRKGRWCQRMDALLNAAKDILAILRKKWTKKGRIPKLLNATIHLLQINHKESCMLILHPLKLGSCNLTTKMLINITWISRRRHLYISIWIFYLPQSVPEPGREPNECSVARPARQWNCWATCERACWRTPCSKTFWVFRDFHTLEFDTFWYCLILSHHFQLQISLMIFPQPRASLWPSIFRFWWIHRCRCRHQLSQIHCASASKSRHRWMECEVSGGTGNASCGTIVVSQILWIDVPLQV